MRLFDFRAGNRPKRFLKIVVAMRSGFAYIERMTTNQMKESYRKLEGCNVARMEGNVSAGTITVTYMNGYRHTFSTVEEVETAQKAFRPSGMNTPMAGALLIGMMMPA